MAEKPSILKHLDERVTESERLERELMGRLEYLEGKYSSQEATLRGNSG